MSAARGPYKRQPHPMEPQIRVLLAEGLNNSRIAEQLNAPPKVVARVRKETGIGPAPRSTYRRPPHPKTREILELLADGHSDREIRRRTGAGIQSISAMRKAGRFGKATIKPKPRTHPRDTEIRALLAEHSSSAIARMLGVDRAAVRRIRGEAGIPYVPAEQARTLEEKWASHTRPADGGHVEWTGERQSTSGSPTMRYKEASYSPAAVAFRIKHGRDAVGYTIADCGLKHCVAPDHVVDEAGRIRIREQLRYVMGGQVRKPFCRHGHDQAEHGRYETDGTAYCEACKVEQKRAERQAVAS
ncbi:hypothetical protein STRTUCAR8_08623 [Streptomyces turgidiscabies Car8]|uniref:Uncharacterized protein n=1 Tax=Streptomyces turgidiscabies (strain Car8) TaxID=698760 RepID=L7F9C1_STRT8|nr:hypothetical protein [Streptomyces turgidiscabies]ELP67626.1 hypothetical protein STRTUCAR8_08623 [Streptomyces turgidiscabies Car8]